MTDKVKLAGTVLAVGPDGTVLLDPDSELPDWAAEAITNPKAWEVPPGASSRRRKNTES